MIAETLDGGISRHLDGVDEMMGFQTLEPPILLSPFGSAVQMQRLSKDSGGEQESRHMEQPSPKGLRAGVLLIQGRCRSLISMLRPWRLL